MSWTVAAKVAAHNAILTRLATGSGTARLALYAGATLLAAIPIAHASCTVSESTGVLTLVASASGSIVATGITTKATLIARDDTVLEDNIPVQQGSSPVAGKVVLATLSLESGGTVALSSGSVG